MDAGDLATWLRGMQAALRGEADADVPCNGCTTCCESSQFVHVDPDETDALARIPEQLRFPAPDKRSYVLPYDEHGRCPMLVDGRCSIYEHRPRTCRVYDCRLLAATGVGPDETKVALRRRVAEWRFRDEDAAGLAALRARAREVGPVRAVEDARWT